MPFCTDDPAELLKVSGWAIEQLTWPGNEDANYSRYPVGETRAANERLRTHLIIGRKDPV